MARSELFWVISDIGFQNQFSTAPNPELQLAVATLVSELQSLPLSNRERRVIIWRLGQFGSFGKPALPAIIKVVREGYSDAMVLHALANIGASEYWPDIIAVTTNKLASRDERSQMAAIRLLGTIGTKAAPIVPQLVAIIEQSSASQQAITESVLIALAQIGNVPPNLKSRLAEMMAEGSRASGAAAAAMLRIDPTDPTALSIVQSRLHPLVEMPVHQPMVDIVCRNPFIARLMKPQLTKLATRTNVTTAQQARFALSQITADQHSDDR
jgi:hypothetical protein